MNAVTKANVTVRRTVVATLLALALLFATELSAQTTTALPCCSSTDGQLHSLDGSKNQTLAGDEIASSLDDASNPSGLEVSAVGVYRYADQVYMTLDSETETVVDIDIYSLAGAHIAKALQGHHFTSGKQRFGVGLPKKLQSGQYLLKVTNDRGSTSATFILSR